MRQHPPSERDDVPRQEAHPEPKVFDADVTSLEVSERRKYCVRLFWILFIDVVPRAAIEEEFPTFVNQVVVRAEGIVAGDKLPE